MNFLRAVAHFIVKYERFLFLVCLAFVAGFIFTCQWQVNEDGPAHIYNSIVYRELLLHPTSPLDQVFELNSTPVPNCFGHFLLAFFTSFLPLDISEKLLHLIMVLGICLSFRFLCKQINPAQPFYSWLIFPFVYSGLYFLGFNNFYLGISLFFLASATWLWAEKKENKKGPYLLLTFLSVILLLSHLIPWFLFVMVAGGGTLIHLFRKEYRLFFTKAGTLALILLPALILTILYYQGRTETISDTSWADPSATFTRLFRLKYLIVFEQWEGDFSFPLSLLLLGAAAFSIFLFIRRRKTQPQEHRAAFFFWGACWLFLLALVFLAPDDFGGSGAMTMRLVELSTLFLLLFLVAGRLPGWLVLPMALVSFFITIRLNQIRLPEMGRKNKEEQIVMRLSKDIEENCTGAYIPFTKNWLRLHMGELAFAEKKSALLSNYETVHDFFVLKWKKEFVYNYTIGGLPSAELYSAKCFWPAAPGKPEKHIDYVLLEVDDITDTLCYNRLHDSLQKYYIVKRSEQEFTLYQSRQSITRGH